jgi:coenzyme PQQ precursor peptide PqqA
MEWEKPEIVEISLACEISSYTNAELGDHPPEQQGELRFESGR